jgi:hypothetical protein
MHLKMPSYQVMMGIICRLKMRKRGLIFSRPTTMSLPTRINGISVGMIVK